MRFIDLCEVEIHEGISKNLGNGQWEFGGKKGVWRTTKTGDRMFFPADGSTPLGISAAKAKALGLSGGGSSDGGSSGSSEGSSADGAKSLFGGAADAMRSLRMMPERADRDLMKDFAGAKRTFPKSADTWEASGIYTGMQLPSGRAIDAAMSKNGWNRVSTDGNEATYSHKDDPTATATVRRLTGERRPGVYVSMKVKNNDVQARPDLSDHPRAKTFMKNSKAAIDAVSAIADVKISRQPKLNPESGSAMSIMYLKKKNGKKSTMRDAKKYAEEILKVDPSASISRKDKYSLVVTSNGGSFKGGMEYKFQRGNSGDIGLTISSNVGYGLD